MRIAVAGCTGMLGSALLHLRADLAPWNSKRVDVRSAKAVEEAFVADRPDVVINAAAWTDVDGAEAHRDEAFAVNRDGAAHLAESCARHGALLVHVSTDYVFDGEKKDAYVETDPVRPLGVYGASKLAGEEEVQRRAKDWAIARTAWLYGPWSRRNFVDTMLKLTAERESVDVVSDVTGSPTMSLDLADSLLFMVASKLRGIYNVANSGQTTWHGLASKIVELKQRRCRVNPVSQSAFPRPARRPSNSVLSVSKLMAKGYLVRSWEDALARYLAGGASPPPA